MNDHGDIYAAKYIIVDAFDCREGSALYVRNGEIEEISSFKNLAAQFPAARIHLFETAAILPGFVNSHHHCFGVNFVNQGISDDLLEPWIIASAGAAVISNKNLTEFTALRLLKNGVTGVVDACTAASTIQASELKIHEKMEIYGKYGLSCAIAPGERWQNRIVHQDGQDRSFLNRLPERVRTKLERDHISRPRLAPNLYLNLISQSAAEYRSSKTGDVWFGPTAPHWTGSSLLRDIARVAKEHDIRVQTHAEESFFQHKVTGCSMRQHPVSKLTDAGMLNTKLSLSHMVWADDASLGRVAKAKTHIVCNPSSNLRLRSGTAPAWKMKEFGINLALGLDGTSLAGDDDMFAEMRLARNLYWPEEPLKPGLSSKDVFEMATMGGARLMGTDRRNGSLTPGKRADFILLDMKTIQRPWVSNSIDPIELIVSSAKSSDILAVYVNGSKAVDRNTLCNGDETEITRKIMEETESSVDRRLNKDDYTIVRSALLRWYEDHHSQNMPPPLEKEQDYAKKN